MQSANEPDRIPTRPVRVPLVRHDRPPSNESSSEKPPSPLGSPPTIPSDTMKTPCAETFDPYNSALNDDVRSMRYTPQGHVDLYGCSESDPEPSYVDASWRADSWRIGPPVPRSQLGPPNDTMDLWNNTSAAEAARARRRHQVQSVTEDLRNFDLNEDLQSCINTNVFNCPE